MVRKYYIYYILVFLGSLFTDWIIQFTYYIYKVSLDPGAFRGVKTLFDYNSGIIGDSLLLPSINVLILYLIYSLPVRLKRSLLIKIGFLGVLGDILINYFQGKLNLINWSMPTPFRWSFIGYSHMATFFLQWSYILIFFYILLAHLSQIRKNRQLSEATIAASVLLLIFFVLFLNDYNWLFGL